MRSRRSSWVMAGAILVTGVSLFLSLGAFSVTGPSMEPSLRGGEYIVAEKASYLFREPSRGEIIIFRDHQDPSYIYIKRVIGLPGDIIEVVQDRLTVNAHALDEPYLSDTFLAEFPKRKLGSGEYFALGDNRSLSKDSRNFGPIIRRDIIGRAWMVYTSPGHVRWASHVQQ